MRRGSVGGVRGRMVRIGRRERRAQGAAAVRLLQRLTDLKRVDFTLRIILLKDNLST